MMNPEKGGMMRGISTNSFLRFGKANRLSEGKLKHGRFLRRGMRAACASSAVTGWLAVWCVFGGMSNHGQGAPVPPTELTTIADPPTDDGFPDQGSEDGNRPFFDDFSWRVFVALNWPSVDGVRGAPDKHKAFGDLSVPTVWETWKGNNEIFTSSPTPWDDFQAILPFESVVKAQGGRQKTFSDISKFEDFQQAAAGNPAPPLIAQNRTFVRYETRVNKVEYEFIVTNRYYLSENLPATGQPKLDFPVQSIEIKAAWRELPNDPMVLARFYHRDAQVADWDNSGNLVWLDRKMGLVGFHIVTKTPSRPHWIWSTFEHVDNDKLSPGGISPPSFNSHDLGSTFGSPGTNVPLPNWQLITPGHPLPTNPTPTEVAREPLTESPPSTVAINQGYWNHPAIAPTVWRNYRLVRTQWPIGGNGPPAPSDHVANSTMETYFQNSPAFSDCMRCHRAALKSEFVWFLELHALTSTRDSHEAVRNILKQNFAGQRSDSSQKSPRSEKNDGPRK